MLILWPYTPVWPVDETSKSVAWLRNKRLYNRFLIGILLHFSLSRRARPGIKKNE